MKRSVRVLGHDLDAVRATRDIRGIGFKTPAEIAMKLGIEKPGSWGKRLEYPHRSCGADTVGLLFGPGPNGDVVVLFGVIGARTPVSP